MRRAASTYEGRRRTLIEALADRGIQTTGRSGLNVWIEVPEETPVVQQLLEAGWSVSAGARFRLKSAPAIRVTTATLDQADARRFADALARILGPSDRTHLT